VDGTHELGLLQSQVLVLLASFCVWKKSLVYRDAMLQGIPLFRSDVRRFYTTFKTEVFKVPVSRPDDHAIPSGRPSVYYSIRLDDVPYRPDTSQTKHHPSGRRAFSVRTLLYREATVPSCIRPDVSAARPDASQ
jgi:hypothetical protein